MKKSDLDKMIEVAAIKKSKEYGNEAVLNSATSSLVRWTSEHSFKSGASFVSKLLLPELEAHINDGKSNNTVITDKLKMIHALRKENQRFREALEFSLMTLEHAIALDYLGEGSTKGMAMDAIKQSIQALSPQKKESEL